MGATITLVFFVFLVFLGILIILVILVIMFFSIFLFLGPPGWLSNATLPYVWLTCAFEHNKR